jgi:hypothetical protein
MSVCGSTLHTWLESKPNLYQTSPWTGCQIYLKSKDPTNAINQMTNHIQSYPVISNHIMWGQLYQKKLLNTPDVHRCSMIFMWGNCAYGIIWCIIPPRLSDPCTSQVAVAGCPGAAFTVPVPKDPRWSASAKRAMASVSAVSMETPWWFDENLGEIHMKIHKNPLKIHWNQIFNDFHPLENLIYIDLSDFIFPTIPYLLPLRTLGHHGDRCTICDLPGIQPDSWATLLQSPSKHVLEAHWPGSKELIRKLGFDPYSMNSTT